MLKYFLIIFLTKGLGNCELIFSGDDHPKPGLGINLGPIDNGMSQWVFTNKFKHANEWITVGANSDWKNYRAAGAFQTTWSDDGYPIEFNHNPYGTSYNGYLTSFGNDGNYQTGDYIATFEGTGNITLLGDAINLNFLESNKIEFYVNQTTKNGIILIITKPNVTNIDVRLKEDEFSTQTFDKNYTQVISIFEALRFSEWMIGRQGRSTPNANVEWSTRRPVTYYTQHGRKMVSIEYIVELANLLKKDIWLSIPSEASFNNIVQIAQYIYDNINNETKIIYVEQSTNKGFNNNNRTLQMNLINAWKQVFGVNNTRVKYVLSTWQYYYFDNTLSFYKPEDLKQFDLYSIAGDIAYGVEFNQNGFDIKIAENYTVDTITDIIKQKIYNDEANAIFQAQLSKVKLNVSTVGYNVGFLVHAPGFSLRWRKDNNSYLEQNLEDLIIEALRQPVVEDLMLDFFERWWKSGGGIMFLKSIVRRVDRCLNGGGLCGYQTVLENLNQDPMSVPIYRAAVKWLNGGKSRFPFTSDDIPKEEKLNCTNCVWGICHKGNCVCYDGYSGPSCETLSKKYLDCAPNKTEYAMNLADIPDWSTELTFVDLQRRARKWLAHKLVYPTAWAELDQNDIQLSEDGYPIYIEINKQIGTFLTRDLKAHYPNGKYICLYDGDGFLNFWFEDVQITHRSAGRIEFTVTHKTEMNNGIYYNIIRTNPSNPIRNIRIMEAKFEQTYQDFPFYPAFLEFLRKFKTIRFMPWSRVFEDVDVDWMNRTTDSFYTFTLRTGVSLEKQVLLCNILGINPWFNLPHRASDEYIRNWATYVRDNLRPDVKIYIEVGNECWGTGGSHPCGNYAQKMGFTQNYTIKSQQNYFSPNYQGQICYHAMTGKKFKDLIIEVFNETYQNTDRINLIFGSQAAWSGPTEVFFLCNGDYFKSYDMIAIAPYMSAPLKKDDGSLVTLEEFYETTVYQSIENAVRVTEKIGILIKNKTEGKMKFGLYEAGPDFSSLTDTANTELTELSFKIHRDPRMYEALRLYLTNITRIKDVNLDMFSYFISNGLCSKYGCWGILESTDSDWTTSPKYKAYMEHIDSEATCEWEERENNCHLNCSSNGVCGPNLVTGKKEICSCTFGAQGEFCEQPNYIISTRCTYQCSGHGVCEFNHTEGFYSVHTCHCQTGYFGYGCEIFECKDNCNFNGKCVDNNTCSCFRGYKGINCEIDCGCSTHGNCSKDSNLCICDRGYSFVNNKCELDCTVDPQRSECSSCLDCGFGTCIRGSCQCWAGYTNDIRNSCTIPTRSPNDGSKIGINLNGVVDYSPQWAFVDIAKMGREWIIQHMDKLNDLYIWSLNEKFNLTNDRFPSSVPHERKFVTLLLRDMYGKWPDSDYHVEYEGEGDVEFGFDAQIIEHKDKNKMKIRVKMSSIRDNGVFLKIHKINASNPIRNLRVVMDGFQDIYEKIPFHPLFMERLKKFKTIRFMPWTEEKNITKWSQRITTTSYTLGNGVALEYQILLANLLKVNPWFIVPYAADDNFVTEMAKMVLAQLRKDVTIYLEYTNEAWNDFFDSGKHCIEQGKKLGLSSDPVIARNLYYSKRSKEIIEIWKNVFGLEKERVVLVIGSFTLMPIMSTRILEYQNVYLSHSRIMLAVTGYIDCASPSAALVANSDLSSLFTLCDSDLGRMNETIRKHLVIARNLNVSFGFYESGSGLSELSVILSGSETPGATDKYIAWNRDPRMYQVYKNYYNLFERMNLTENCHYAYVGLASKYGPWYLMEHQNQSLQEAHRYRAILEIIDETRMPVNDYEDITCDGILFNSSEVCKGEGFCVKKNICEPFKKPTKKSDIKISSLSGIALVDNFFLSTDNWNSDLPLKYAYGIEHSEYGQVRLTDYLETTNVVTILPYLESPYRIILFVSDTRGNIYLDYSVNKVNTSRFNGNFADFTQLSKNFTKLQNSIAMYDKSFNTSQLADTILGSLDLNGGDLDETISDFDYYSSKFDKEPTAKEKISDKFTDFFSKMERNIENGTFSSITSNQTSGLLNVLSNIYDPISPLNVEKLMSSFVKILTNMNDLQTPTGISGISASNFNSKNLNLTVISIETATASLVNYLNIKIDASEIFSANKLGKVSLINYPKENSLSMVTKQIDVKFFVNGSVIGVQNLNSPIKLNFEIDESTVNTIQSKYKLVCKFFDENLQQWSDSGCSLSKLDTVNKNVECSCTHATKFSVLLDQIVEIPIISPTPPGIKSKSSNLDSKFSLILFGFIFLKLQF
ncbi:unnamed protein product [Brachionus calyciflorus]|uniref:EGF-like domain-containing protein n=1 Tax=Brachionus calyciflorus TaxID=104777 RepID=A0A813ZMK8_9BILA|nr:unnamed protein product [Brachionus calyciflorus]